MANYETETLRLIDALPINGNLFESDLCGDCALNYDANGTRNSCYEATALNTGVAEALHDGDKSVSFEVENELSHEAHFRDPIRMGEYARCLLARASGDCIFYNPKTKRDRTQTEIDEYFETWRRQHAS